MYPNANYSGVDKSKVSQWVLSAPTLVLIDESCEKVEWIVYEIILNVGSRLNLER